MSNKMYYLLKFNFREDFDGCCEDKIRFLNDN